MFRDTIIQASFSKARMNDRYLFFDNADTHIALWLRLPTQTKPVSIKILNNTIENHFLPSFCTPAMLPRFIVTSKTPSPSFWLQSEFSQ